MTLPKDFIPGAIILVVCGGLFYLTTQFETDPLGMTQGMPATYMPRLVLTIIASLAVLMIVQGVLAGKVERKDAPPLKMWSTAIILGIAAATFETIGVPLAFFGVCVVIPYLWGARNYLAICIFAVALPAAIFIVFRGVLGLRLPLGPLSFLF